MTKTKKTSRKTVSKSTEKPKSKPIGWGIDQQKYDEARKPKPRK